MQFGGILGHWWKTVILVKHLHYVLRLKQTNTKELPNNWGAGSLNYIVEVGLNELCEYNLMETLLYVTQGMTAEEDLRTIMHSDHSDITCSLEAGAGQGEHSGSEEMEALDSSWGLVHRSSASEVISGGESEPC